MKIFSFVAISNVYILGDQGASVVITGPYHYFLKKIEDVEENLNSYTNVILYCILSVSIFYFFILFWFTFYVGTNIVEPIKVNIFIKIIYFIYFS